MAPDTLMSLSVNTAVCPPLRNKKEVGSAQMAEVRPTRGLGVPGGRQSPGRADAWRQPRRRETGPEQQLGAWRSPEKPTSKGEVTASWALPRRPPLRPQGAPAGPHPKAESRHARAGGPDPPTSHLPSPQRLTSPAPRPWRPPTSPRPSGSAAPRWSRGHARPHRAETPATRDAEFTSEGGRAGQAG